MTKRKAESDLELEVRVKSDPKTQLVELKRPWIDLLSPFIHADPAGMVVEYMIDFVYCNPDADTHVYPESKMPIALLFYGSFSITSFVANIIPDGERKPLGKILFGPFRKTFPKFNLSHMLDDDASYDGLDDPPRENFCRLAWKKGYRMSKTLNRFLSFRLKLGGQDYIAVYTPNRDDYRRVANVLCGEGQKHTHESWKCQHAVVICGFENSVYGGLCEDWPMTLDQWKGTTHLLISNWFDLLYAMKLKRAPDTLWHALQ